MSKTTRFRPPEERLVFREVREDRKYRCRMVTSNKGRSREKQDLRRRVEEEDYD